MSSAWKEEFTKLAFVADEVPPFFEFGTEERLPKVA